MPHNFRNAKCNAKQDKLCGYGLTYLQNECEDKRLQFNDQVDQWEKSEELGGSVTRADGICALRKAFERVVGGKGERSEVRKHESTS